MEGSLGDPLPGFMRDLWRQRPMFRSEDGVLRASFCRHDGGGLDGVHGKEEEGGLLSTHQQGRGEFGVQASFLGRPTQEVCVSPSFSEAKWKRFSIFLHDFCLLCVVGGSQEALGRIQWRSCLPRRPSCGLPVQKLRRPRLRGVLMLPPGGGGCQEAVD